MDLNKGDSKFASISAPLKFGSLTPADSEIGYVIRGIFVGTGGDIAVRNDDNEAVVFKNVPDGTYLPVITDIVYSTSTTATDLVRFK